MADVEEVRIIALHATSWDIACSIGSRITRDPLLPIRSILYPTRSTVLIRFLLISVSVLVFFYSQRKKIMPYPDSPFVETFRSQLITCLNEEKSDTTISNDEYEKTLKWLCSSPKITSFRVNTLKSSCKTVLEAIKKHICEVSDERSVNIDVHPVLCNVIILKNSDVNEKLLEKHYKEIVVDVDCAAAVLRGAHVYAPGVMAMMSGTQINDKVSIYADPSKKCKKGLQKLYEDDNKVFIGNGIVKMMRHELFGDNLMPRGIAIEVTETLAGCPPLGDHFLPTGYALLQNLPSILCVHALDPQPNETIIDMCASPGNKTTHIAELMQNKGVLVAIDKTSKKVAQLRKTCEEFDAKVHIFEADSSKILSLDFVDSNLKKEVVYSPPFLPETFDRVLLDAPCSVLGKRPQFVNRLSEKMIKSYVPLQRKLFETAVKLLRTNGTLVYSTCTITLAENEGLVAWALRTFKCLQLVRPSLCLGGPGWSGSSLTEEERNCVQRFGPHDRVDSVGFFFACFIKK